VRPPGDEAINITPSMQEIECRQAVEQWPRQIRRFVAVQFTTD